MNISNADFVAKGIRNTKTYFDTFLWIVMGECGKVEG